MIDASIYLGRVICIADPAEAAARDAAFRDGTAPPPPPFPHLSSGLVGQDATAGLLSPHGRVAWRGREGRWDDVVGHGFHVVLSGENPAGRLSREQRAALAFLGATVVGISRVPSPDVVLDLDGKYAAFFERHDIAGFIARPDFYLFSGVSRAADLPQAVASFLAALDGGGLLLGHVSPSAVVTPRAGMPRARAQAVGA